VQSLLIGLYILHPDIMCVIDMKRTKQQDFQTTWTKGGLILNLGHGIKKIKSKNMTCAWCECKKNLFQKHDNNTYAKLMLHILKIMWKFIFIYIYWEHSSRKLLKKPPIYMWFMFTHVWPCAPVCGPCPSMWKLIMKYGLIKSELEMNWNLTMN